LALAHLAKALMVAQAEASTNLLLPQVAAAVAPQKQVTQQQTALAETVAMVKHRASLELRCSAQRAAVAVDTPLAALVAQEAAVTAAVATPMAQAPQRQALVAVVRLGRQAPLAHQQVAMVRRALLSLAPISLHHLQLAHPPHQQAAVGIFTNLRLTAA